MTELDLIYFTALKNNNLRTHKNINTFLNIYSTLCCQPERQRHCYFVGQFTNLSGFIWMTAASWRGQPVGFNQELDLFCSIPVINWLIISGLVPLNYGADCKWTWWSSELEATYTKWDTSSRFLPCLVTAHTLLWLPIWRWRNIFSCWAPFTTLLLSSSKIPGNLQFIFSYNIFIYTYTFK